MQGVVHLLQCDHNNPQYNLKSHVKAICCNSQIDKRICKSKDARCDPPKAYLMMDQAIEAHHVTHPTVDQVIKILLGAFNGKSYRSRSTVDLVVEIHTRHTQRCTAMLKQIQQ